MCQATCIVLLYGCGIGKSNDALNGLPPRTRRNVHAKPCHSPLTTTIQYKSAHQSIVKATLNTSIPMAQSTVMKMGLSPHLDLTGWKVAIDCILTVRLCTRMIGPHMAYAPTNAVKTAYACLAPLILQWAAAHCRPRTKTRRVPSVVGSSGSNSGVGDTILAPSALASYLNSVCGSYLYWRRTTASLVRHHHIGRVHRSSSTSTIRKWPTKIMR